MILVYCDHMDWHIKIKVLEVLFKIETMHNVTAHISKSLLQIHFCIQLAETQCYTVTF